MVDPRYKYKYAHLLFFGHCNNASSIKSNN